MDELKILTGELSLCFGVLSDLINLKQITSLQNYIDAFISYTKRLEFAKIKLLISSYRDL